LKTSLNSLDFVLRPNTYYVVKLQNLLRTTTTLTGEANTTTYTLSESINLEDVGLSSPQDLVGCYITTTATSLHEAISQNITITSYDAENLTLGVSATLNADIQFNNRLVYIYNNDTANIYWQFMGEYQPRAEIKETNPDSPFYVNGSVGEIKITLAGGEYDNISTSELAYERAKWELYTRCRLLDSMTLTCLPIYWLDVNWLVSITLPTEDESKLYMIKEISTTGGVTGTQSITLMSFYDYYDEA
jgi:hypothetical protein